MEKLAAADASFLYSETSKCNSNVASVQIMELPSGVTPGQFIASLKTYMSERLHLVSYLHRKLAFVPGNWDHPVWVHDHNFNIDNHVIEYPVPLPGNQAEMEQVIAALHEIKMPLDRPLWAMYVLTGLADGNVAYYNQAHHAALDGASGNAAFDILMDDIPVHPPVPAAKPVTTETDNSSLRMIEDAYTNFVRFQLETGNRMLGAMDTSRRLINRFINPNKEFGAFGKTAPATPFNTQISEKRTWSALEVPLADVKQMGKNISVTINEMVMAICAGALRSYLDRDGQLPEQSLIAGCPVSLRKPGDTTPGNQVTMMNVELATQIADPLERLAAIKASSETAKEMVADLSGLFEGNAALPGMPAIISANMNATESFGLAQFVRGPINVVISNVPGPRNTLYSNGARMTTHYPVSIPAHGLGLNITVQSYVDQMYFGITACGKAVPDAGLLRDDLISAFRELKARLLPANVSELKPREPLAAPSKAQFSDSDQEIQKNKVA
jgi:WS/DGAT/MGAT family acyltransferase